MKLRDSACPMCFTITRFYSCVVAASFIPSSARLQDVYSALRGPRFLLSHLLLKTKNPRVLILGSFKVIKCMFYIYTLTPSRTLLIPSGVRSFDRLIIAYQEVGIKPACLAMELKVLCIDGQFIVFLKI